MGRDTQAPERHLRAVDPKLGRIIDEVVRRSGPRRFANSSVRKARFLCALAEHVADGRVALEAFDDAPDASIVEALTIVPGVGVWTAQMFLMFRLQRPDVLPTGDLGIRKGLQVAHGLRKIAAPGYVERAGKKWGPWRSIASLYLWSAVDLKLLEPLEIP